MVKEKLDNKRLVTVVAKNVLTIMNKENCCLDDAVLIYTQDCSPAMAKYDYDEAKPMLMDKCKELDPKRFSESSEVIKGDTKKNSNLNIVKQTSLPLPSSEYVNFVSSSGANIPVREPKKMKIKGKVGVQKIKTEDSEATVMYELSETENLKIRCQKGDVAKVIDTQEKVAGCVPKAFKDFF